MSQLEPPSTMNCPASSSMYALQDVPGKGKGLIATRKLPRGTRIIVERPLISILADMDDGRRRRFIRQQVEALSNDQRHAFLSMHNIHRFDDVEDQYLGIFSTNALSTLESVVYNDDQPREAVFLEASRINHDCDNNALHEWNARIKQHTVHTIRDIDAGEEITISYVELLEKRESRQKTLRELFGFTCSCRLCSLPDEQSQERDRKLDQIARLNKLWKYAGGEEFTTLPLKTLGYLHSLVRLYSELGLEDDGFATVYKDAAYFVLLHGDAARACLFSLKALSVWEKVVGADHTFSHRCRIEAECPSRLPLYGDESDKWMTAEHEVPQGLEPDDFEHWLWKRENPKDLAQPTSLPKQSHFSGLADLPTKNDVGTGVSSNKRHWCFLGEIVDTQVPHPLELEIKDIHGKKIKLHFYTKDEGSELKPSQYQNGHTVAVLDAARYVFKFGPPGIRHEDPHMVKTFPLSLAMMLGLYDKVRKFSVRQHDGTRKCHGCGVNAPASSMKRCSMCFSFWYCNKECQATGWTTKAHKIDCKFLRDPDLRGLLLVEWDEIQEGIRFPLKIASSSS
ncbi:hypothetical protein E4U09_003030 [Claviceps aff. purpurea]|uniref:Suppressor of anucleate metulae protein B n=1 Tax=Claviceps aff. purpurea TaxID=1967640 RepID=A0A9P7QFS9_9HYPO|nr:hypothetical protein E4U09_003030 [Claviceps aff. purpurea]